MSKEVKASLDKRYRSEIETLKRDTGQSIQQIVNFVWERGDDAKNELRRTFNKALNGKASK